MTFIGQVTAIIRTDSSPHQPIVTAASYLPFGPLQSLAFAGGATQAFTHDQNYWTDGVGGTALALDFTLDATGNIVAANNPAPANAREYTYDPLARLTDIDDGNAALIEAFTYDGTGNRLSRQTPAGTQAYGYELNSHRLTSSDSQTRTFDAMGSLTTRGTDTFTYDDRQRLASAGTATYTYNARGERVSKTVGGVTTLFAYDDAGHLIAELDASTTPATPLRSYVWLDDRPVATYAHSGAYANQWLHIHTDHLGTPRAITRPAASNATVWRWDFHGSAFGDHAPQSDPDGDAIHFTFNLRFPGQYFDAESGLHYNYFRDYEASTGRYVESDPIGLEGGVSTYGYAFQRPSQVSDALGLDGSPFCGGASGVAFNDPSNPGACIWEEPQRPKTFCELNVEFEFYSNLIPFVGTGIDLIQIATDADGPSDLVGSSGVTASAVASTQADAMERQRNRVNELRRMNRNRREQARLGNSLRLSGNLQRAFRAFARLAYPAGVLLALDEARRKMEECKCE